MTIHHLLVEFWLWGLNLGHRPVLTKEFDLAPVHRPHLVSPPSDLLLVSEPVSSHVGFNRLCDLNVTWRKVP
jgi:hypothetical protein